MIAIQAAFRSHWQSSNDYTAHRVLIHQDIGILVRTKFRYSFLFPSNERLIFFESFEQQMILHEAKFQWTSHFVRDFWIVAQKSLPLPRCSGDFWNYDFLVCHPAFCCTSRTSFALTRVFLLAKLRFTWATLLCQFGAKHSTLKSFTALVEPRIAVCEFLWRLRPNLTIHPVESRTYRTSEYDNERGS